LKHRKFIYIWLNDEHKHILFLLVFPWEDELDAYVMNFNMRAWFC